MGRIIIEVPQNENRTYCILGESDGRDVIDLIENGLSDFRIEVNPRRTNVSVIEPPSRNPYENDDDALGIRANYSELASEISERLRRSRNKRESLNTDEGGEYTPEQLKLVESGKQ